MDKDIVLKIFEEIKVIQKGHFLLTSGRHSDTYMQCARLFEYPEYSEKIASDIAEAFKDDHIDVVIGPAMGGIILSYEVARKLNARNIFAERTDGIMSIRRGFDMAPGQNILIVEDVVTTGGSVFEVIELVKETGANISGVGLVVDRSNGKVDFGYKQHAVLTTEVISYDANECPICSTDIPLKKPGSRTPAK
ncbi:MAG: orotate phosphoribosyltransferase [Clostridia bacterium]|nr:orotate phosphoribosyltransferase [Clostridia bacterium]